MVAAKVRDGGSESLCHCEERVPPVLTTMTGNPSEIFLKCLEEVQAISCATLFSPVARQEAVQAMGKRAARC